jgi:hypothetical protein
MSAGRFGGEAQATQQLKGVCRRRVQAFGRLSTGDASATRRIHLLPNLPVKGEGIEVELFKSGGRARSHLTSASDRLRK